MFASTFAVGQASAAPVATSSRTMVYLGTNTTSTSRGIYRFFLDNSTGQVTPLELAAQVKNPTFLALSPDGRRLYAVSEISDFQGHKAGGVCGFSIDTTTGNLTLLNQQPSGGQGPCHVSVSPDGHFAAVANYGNGSIALLPIQANGTLTSPTSVIQHTGHSVNPQRQAGPHAHSVNFDAAGRYAYAADLGIDQVKTYRVDPDAQTLVPVAGADAAMQPGAGPRHLAFHPNGGFAYVVTEMGNTVTVFRHDADSGALTEVQTTSTLPVGYSGKTFASEVRVHPTGKFLYASNRGHDSIAIFAIDSETGKLTSLGHEPAGGKFPRNFNIDPTGQWLIATNQDSNNIVIFRIDPTNGMLHRTGEIADIHRPMCVVFVPVR